MSFTEWNHLKILGTNLQTQEARRKDLQFFRCFFTNLWLSAGWTWKRAVESEWRNNFMLHTELIPAAEKSSRLMVMLHGLGDSIEGYRWMPETIGFPWL